MHNISSFTNEFNAQDESRNWNKLCLFLSRGQQKKKKKKKEKMEQQRKQLNDLKEYILLSSYFLYKLILCDDSIKNKEETKIKP